MIWLSSGAHERYPGGIHYQGVMRRIGWLMGLLCLAASAQTPGGGDGPVLGLTATPLDGDDVRVDGRLDEAAWGRAQAATDFVQLEPTPGAPASERTEAFVLYDRAALYVGLRCYVRDPATLVRRLVRRDDFGEGSDRVFVEIGSPADGRTAYSFGVSLAGVQQDVVLFNDQNNGDLTWDAVWDSAVGRFEGPGGEGYAVEIRVPFSQLRYDADSSVPWQIQFQRDVAATGETDYWAPIPPDADGYVSRFGQLHGLRDLRAPRRIEVVPYAATRAIRAPGDPADPFYAETDLSPAVGFDASVGLTSSLTLTATVNPDFGQVEQDPADVNLTDFERRFPERRPFFVEGVDAFAFGWTRASAYVTEQPEFFYSRRIGRSPQSFGGLYGFSGPDGTRDTPDDVVYFDSPEQTTILGAAKLSGQVGEWTVGVLTALTGRETAAFVTAGGDRAELPVEPLSNYAVARARRAWNGGRTGLGLFGSSVLRDADGTAFSAVVPTDATVAGVDAEHTFAGREWSVSALVAGSAVRGGEGAVARLQRSSRRYYQRTDAHYLDLDPDRASLTGYRAEATVARVGGGRHWRGAVTLGATSPGFETNDLGFQRRADWAGGDWRVNYSESQPGVAGVQRISAYLYGAQYLNYGGDLVYNRFNTGGSVRFSNLWTVSSVVAVRPEYVNDRLTRGGPLALRPADYSASLTVSTNPSRPLQLSASVADRREVGHDYAGVDPEWTRRVRLGVTARPSETLEVSFEPEWTSAYGTDQYLFSAADPNAPDGFGGRRYLFADVRSEALFLAASVDWAFSPDVTLQLYAGPYIDARRYVGYRQLAARRSYDFVRFGETAGTALDPFAVGPDDEAVPSTFEAADFFEATDAAGESVRIYDEDFTYLSLRGNAVARWQWRPGSELFLVWQQTRDDFGALRGLDVFGDVADVFGGEVRNVFQLKATYWFGL